MNLEAVAEVLPDALVILDPLGRVAGWYGSSQRLLGYSFDTAKGQSLEQLLNATDNEGNPTTIGRCDSAAIERIIRSVPERELTIRTGTGVERQVGVTWSYQRDTSGGVAGTVVSLRDASARKRSELSRGDVISSVSHELRSPLTSIKGFTSTMINKWERLDDETKREMLEMIHTDADRVTRMIGELLDISRLDAGRLVLKKDRIDLKELIAGVVEKLSSTSTDHEITVEFDEELSPAFADPDKITQVVTNLVENALKYTEGGKVRVSCRSGDEFYEVSVSDEGEGIGEEDRLRVFTKFFRAAYRTGSPTGTGLGLYISKGLVEAHGGRIWTQPSEAGGSEFKFTLPVGT